MASAKPLLCFLPGLAILAMTIAVAAYRGNPLTDLQWLFVRTWLAAMVALAIVKVAIADRGIVGIQARWERALIRWLLLLSVGLSVFPCFVALDYVARMLLLGAWATHACAVVLVAVHLRLGWVAIFGAYS